MFSYVKGRRFSKSLEQSRSVTGVAFAGTASLIPKMHMRSLRPCCESVKHCRGILRWTKRRPRGYSMNAAIVMFESGPQKSIEYGLYRCDLSSNFQLT